MLPGLLFPFWSTQKQYAPRHCILSKEPSGLHRGTYRPMAGYFQYSWYCRWHKVRFLPKGAIFIKWLTALCEVKKSGRKKKKSGRLWFTRYGQQCCAPTPNRCIFMIENSKDTVNLGKRIHPWSGRIVCISLSCRGSETQKSAWCSSNFQRKKKFEIFSFRQLNAILSRGVFFGCYRLLLGCRSGTAL